MTEHHWSDLAAAYALGSLEPGERSEFEGHLATCTDCIPNEASLLRLVSAMAAEISEEWETGRIYLNPESE